MFGCGHHDWSQTYHRVPKLLDTAAEARGGLRLLFYGAIRRCKGTDVCRLRSNGRTKFCEPALQEKYGVPDGIDGDDALTPIFSVQFSAPRSSTLRQDVKEAVVTSTTDLTAPGGSPKKHMEIELPSDMHYTAGDYLAVLPLNPKEIIHRAMRRFQLAWDTHITIQTDRRTTLPTNTPLPVTDVLGALC